MGYQLCTTLSPEIKSQQKLPFFLLLFSPQLRPSAWTEWTVLACHRSLPLKLPLSILRDDFTDRAVISKNLWMHASSFHGKRYRVVLHATFSWLFLFLLVFLFVLFLFFCFSISIAVTEHTKTDWERGKGEREELLLIQVTYIYPKVSNTFPRSQYWQCPHKIKAKHLRRSILFFGESRFRETGLRWKALLHVQRR